MSTRQMNNQKPNKPINYERAKWLALYYLGIKARTETEIRKKLSDKGADEALCEKTIAFLKDYGYIDDEAYVRMYINDACNIKHHGLKRIKADLRMKGIREDIIDLAVEETEPNFPDSLIKLIERKAASADLSDYKQKNRLIAFLQRRGYSINEILTAIREYTEEN